MMKKKPWMKFYPGDWRADEALRSCSIAARGLWIEMIALMHSAEPYGSLLIKGKRIDKKRLASLAGISEKECSELLFELEGMSVFSRDEDGTIYSRKMRRAAAKLIEDKENGAKGGNPKLKAGVNPPDNRTDNGEDKAHILEARGYKNTEAIASDADASDPKKRLFDEGIPKLRKLTGKGPDACRAFFGKCLKEVGDDAIVVLAALEDAERNEAIDPSAYIVARLKGRSNIDFGSKNGKATGSAIEAAKRQLARIEQERDDPALSIAPVLGISNRSVRGS